MYTIITSREAQLRVPLGHGMKPVDDCVSSRDHPLLSLICCLLTFPFSACEWEQHGWWPLLSSATDSFSSPCWFHIDQWTERLSQILSWQNCPWCFCSDVFEERRALPFSHSFCAVRGETIYHITPRPGPVVPLYKYSSSKEAQNQGFSLTRNINAKVRFRNIILVLHMRDFRMERWRLLAFLHWCRYVKFQN